jgi:hypothetical protein
MDFNVTYAEVDVTPERLALLFSRMWDRGREELERLGISPTDAFRMLLAYPGRKGILTADGEPILAAGISEANGEAFTWFQATDEFELHASQITRTLRRNVRKHEGQVFIYSVMVHPLTERWFNALGFVRDDWTGTTAANWPLFRFKRRNYVFL